MLPQILTANEQGKQRFTPKEQIKFAPATQTAFDHTGNRITHRTMPDGSRAADHNGSMGNVTVARMGPDGNIETYCTTDEANAKAWMAGEIGVRPAASTLVPARSDQP